jgi:hypothetical protein
VRELELAIIGFVLVRSLPSAARGDDISVLEIDDLERRISKKLHVSNLLLILQRRASPPLQRLQC